MMTQPKFEWLCPLLA